MIAQGLLIPAVIVLGLNIWTTNDNALNDVNNKWPDWNTWCSMVI